MTESEHPVRTEADEQAYEPPAVAELGSVASLTGVSTDSIQPDEPNPDS